MPVFALFPSMGVWAMRSRLLYFIQPLYQVGSKTVQDRSNVASQLDRSVAYREAQSLRQKLQNTINLYLKQRL